MTETPPGRPSEPRTGHTAPAPAHGDGPTRPSTPTGRTALRDRIAEAVLAFHGRTGADASDRALAYGTADAVMPIIEGLPNRGYCEHCGRGDCAPTAEQYHQQTQRAEKAERALAQARDAIADERRGRLAAEAAVRRVRALCSRGPGPANEYQIWTVDVLAALDAEGQQDETLAAVERVRRMAQVWIDIRPQHPTATTDAHTVAWAGEQIIAALEAEQPKETP